MKPVTTIDDPRYVKALSHPLRVRILAILEEGEASPVRLAELLDATLGTVAYHVRTLHGLGLLELVRETRRRGAIEHTYRARGRPTISDEAWAHAPTIAKQALIGASLQQLSEYARASAAAGGFDGADSHLTRTVLRLDARGWEELARACGRLLEEAEQLQAAAAERLSGESHPDDAARRVALVMLLFEGLRLNTPPASRARATR